MVVHWPKLRRLVGVAPNTDAYLWLYFFRSDWRLFAKTHISMKHAEFICIEVVSMMVRLL